MIRLVKISSCVAALGVLACASQASNFLDELYNTGVDAGRNPLAIGAVDNHYALASNPEGYDTAYVVGGYQGYWLTSNYGDTVSQWISPLPPTSNGDADNIGNTTNLQFGYTVSFRLGDNNQADIRGFWMADNGTNKSGDQITQIFVNGQKTGQTIDFTDPDTGHSAFDSWHAFELKGDYFKANQLNTITFSVANWPQENGNPSGVRVAFTSANTAVPEPFTVGLCAAGLGLALKRRAKKKA